jgi:hypothetical protein
MVSRLCIFRLMPHAYEDLALYRIKLGGARRRPLHRNIAGGRDSVPDRPVCGLPQLVVEPWIEHCMAIGTLGSIRVTTRIDGR